VSAPRHRDPARAALEGAVAHFRAGRVAECERAVRELLDAEPRRADALELLGVALGMQGRHAEALAALDRALDARATSASILHNRAQALFHLARLAEARADLEKALRLAPDRAPSWNLLGSTLAASGDAQGAERAYRKAVQADPSMAEAHYNLARLLQESGRADEAIAGYRRSLALRPQFAQAHNNLANALKVAGRTDEALAHYAEAVRADPRLADALSNFGTLLRELRRFEEAIPLLERAAQLKPDSSPVLNNLGIAYHERHDDVRAAACYRRALELEPGFVEARNNLGNALASLGEEAEATACYREVIERAPAHPDAYSNLGVLLQERGEADAAIASYRKALELRPDHSDALSNVGYLLQEQGRVEEAIAYYRRALEANPGLARAGYNLGIALLARHDFTPGWELHEKRFETVPPIALARRLAMPPFTPADWEGPHRVAVWREQGIGDQLLYSTLLAELAERGQSFVLEADRRLVPALARAHPDWTVVEPGASEAAFASCDRHIAVGSLARLLRPTAATFARQPRALLAADPARVEAYRSRIAAPGKRSVAVSWRSFQPKARGYLQRKKSMDLAAFMGLSRRDDLRLLDVQYGDTAAEREAFATAGGRLERFEELDLYDDLEGVLAAVQACDLVVTTSNVTAHFGGALGKETLLVYLSGNPPFHYWVPGPDGRCLWYPSVRVVTARGLDTWDKAMARVDELLRA